MRITRVILIIAAAAACKGDAAQPFGPTAYHVDGQWQVNESLSSGNGIGCWAQGIVTVTQSGAYFSGSGTGSSYCSAPTDTVYDPNASFRVTGGAIDGTSVTMAIDNCAYAGTLMGAYPDSMIGTVSCKAIAGQMPALSGTFRVVRPPDPVPPVLSASIAGARADGSFESGDDTVFFRINATDDRSLRYLGFEIANPGGYSIVRRDSVLVYGKAANDTLAWPIPLNVFQPSPRNTPFTARAFARDSSGNITYADLGALQIVDPPRPTVSATTSGPAHDSVGALRDTIAITVTGTALRHLAYYGVRIPTFRIGDSVASADTTGTHTFRFPVPFAWKGVLVDFTIFARDRLGQVAVASLPSVRVVVYPSRPTQWLRVNQGVFDLTVDAARGRVYIGTASDSGPSTGQAQIKIAQYAPAQMLPGILTGWYPNKMDLSLSGDSLLMALWSGRVGVLNLNTFALDSTAALPFIASNGQVGFGMVEMANGFALLSFESAYWGAQAPGQLSQLDLGGSGAARRTDVGASGNIGLTPFLGRSGDRQRMVVYPASATGSAAQLYESATDQFGPVVPVEASGGGANGITGDHTGAHWLMGVQLLGSDLSLQRTLMSPAPRYGASVISDDGLFAYIAVDEGVAKVRTADGAEVERILLPDPPYLLRITPDGHTLFAIAGGLYIVDLR